MLREPALQLVSLFSEGVLETNGVVALANGKDCAADGRLDEVQAPNSVPPSVIGRFQIANPMSSLRWGAQESALAGRSHVQYKAFVLIREV